MMRVDRIKYSYEGEGPGLGLKTYFCHYPGDQDLFRVSDFEQVAAIYVNADYLTNELIQNLKLLSTKKFVTVEIKYENWIEVAYPGDRINFFVVCDKKVAIEKFTGYIKIENTGFGDSALSDRIQLANSFARDGHDVLLMPRLGEMKRSAVEFGPQMMRVFDQIHSKVRLMPPVHELLGIE